MIFKKTLKNILLAFNRLKFILFFKTRLKPNEYTNSKYISLLKTSSQNDQKNDFLVIIRSGKENLLKNDNKIRNFDLALNLYATPKNSNFDEYNYVFSGGINKFKAAKQFLNSSILSKYSGFMYLDDDLEITYTELSLFLSYCKNKNFDLAQPSLTRDSFYSHDFSINVKQNGHRTVPFVEVMCPYFSQNLHTHIINTFDLSYSTWGLDFLWARLLKSSPIVVDEFMVQHAKPINPNGMFYQYMKNIGVSPELESKKLRNMSIAGLQ